MAIIIKGNVQGDIISDGGVKNETHFHYGDEHCVGSHSKKTETYQETNNTLNTLSNAQNVTNITLATERQSIFDHLLDFTDKGDWVNGITPEQVKAMLKVVLGQGEAPLTGKEAELSGKLWRLLENGRGDRVRIVWQNLVGYLDDKKFFNQKGSPALNKDFFGDEENYSNIDKGRPSRDNMSAGFRDVLPLLDDYLPKLDKKA